MKRAIFAAMASVFLAAAAAADTGPETLDLAGCLERALSGGAEIRGVELSLGIARSQHAVNAAKAGLSLVASGGYGLAFGLDDSTLAKRAGASDGLGLAHSASGSLSLSRGSQSSSNPYTKLSLNAAHSIPSSSSGSSPQSSLGLSLAQTLWDGYPGGQTDAAVAKSLLALQGKELTAAQGRSAAAAKVKLAYVAMLSAQRAVATRKAGLDKQNALLAQMKAVYDLQQASSIDLATAEINARSAELDLRGGEKDLRSAMRKLANLIGRTDDSPFSVAEIPEPRLPAASYDEAVAAGLDKRADAAQLELSRRSAAIDLALARAQSKASLGLTAGLSAVIGWGSSGDPKSGESASLGLKLGLPLLDSGSSSAQIEASSAQLALYGLQAEQLRRTIAADIGDCYETALIQAERAELAKSSMDVARAQFEVVRTQNQFGTATNQDMLNASVAAEAAAAAYAAARGAYLTAVIQLETAMGL